MQTIEESAYIILTAVFILILILLVMLTFDVIEASSGGVLLPLVYYSAGNPTQIPSPTPTPRPSPTPTPTKTPEPGALWTWVARAGNIGGETWIFAVIPGYCCELVGEKIGKTINVHAECPAVPACQIFPAPGEIPPPFAWGDVEKLEYPGNSQQVCSTQWPFNCKDTE